MTSLPGARARARCVVRMRGEDGAPVKCPQRPHARSVLCPRCSPVRRRCGRGALFTTTTTAARTTSADDRCANHPARRLPPAGDRLLDHSGRRPPVRPPRLTTATGTTPVGDHRANHPGRRPPNPLPVGGDDHALGSERVVPPWSRRPTLSLALWQNGLTLTTDAFAPCRRPAVALPPAVAAYSMTVGAPSQCLSVDTPCITSEVCLRSVHFCCG
ncbi:Protein of unknown function [Gryllus bimaculatus]|nr:Protein of unknown function [Gryllus bimaculatus]